MIKSPEDPPRREVKIEWSEYGKCPLVPHTSARQCPQNAQTQWGSEGGTASHLSQNRGALVVAPRSAPLQPMLSGIAYQLDITALPSSSLKVCRLLTSSTLRHHTQRGPLLHIQSPSACLCLSNKQQGESANPDRPTGFRGRANPPRLQVSWSWEGGRRELSNGGELFLGPSWVAASQTG